MHFLSSPRRRGSSDFNKFWIPAFAGMTFFTTPIMADTSVAEPLAIAKNLALSLRPSRPLPSAIFKLILARARLS
jgi:hypothetical protein